MSIDTCEGASLIRKDCIPEGVLIKPSKEFSFRAAQVKKLQIEGIVTLSICVGETIFPAVDLFVATGLVVPMLLGAPWLHQNVSSIRPRAKTITFTCSGVEKAYPLLEERPQVQNVVRAVKAAVLEPMSETWLELSTEKSGQVLL